jgi:hypothetical protein
MDRRIIKENHKFEAAREVNGSKNRRFEGRTVLNILQWVQPGIVRFTVEGEGAEIWSCPQAVVDENTEH